MTDQEINIAIAEAGGWTKRDSYTSIQDGSEVFWWRHNSDSTTDCTTKDLPSYTTDLNAMHEAEKMIPTNHQELYADSLLCVIHHVDAGYFSRISWADAFGLISATARQRAEAFLRTLNKWEEK